jgi:hypothetical protein
MKSLNFLFVMAICFMAISHVSATYYIIKTFENYGSKSTEGAEGQLDADGLKRVDCFVKLIGDKINKPQTIFYKSDGVDKNGNIKVNSRKYTAEAIAAKLDNVSTEALQGGDTALASIKDTLVANQINDCIFVWSDKEKASALATALGATGVPAEFQKGNYGIVWAIDGEKFSEISMGCSDVADVDEKKNEEKSASTSLCASFMTIAVAIIASTFLLF